MSNRHGEKSLIEKQTGIYIDSNNENDENNPWPFVERASFDG